MSLCFYDLTDAARAHGILGCESELIPGATLQSLQAVWALTRADGEVAPLFAVVLWILQNVTWTRRQEEQRLGKTSASPSEGAWKKINIVGDIVSHAVDLITSLVLKGNNILLTWVLYIISNGHKSLINW